MEAAERLKAEYDHNVSMYSEAELEFMRQRSAENLALYYLDSLKRVASGSYKPPNKPNGKPRESHDGAVLKRHGLVHVETVGVWHRPRWSLTPLGRATLDKLCKSSE